ncbi:hypothetical protein CPT_Summit_152 [Stenotrophomonas phage Summit]|nr:hypothetical protein CPT_Summit_152 [Stenotrophomonas phage Summit]
MSNKPYTLKDCQQMHKEHPETFEVPSQQELHQLQAGDFVKLIFVNAKSPNTPNERMWVKVTKVGMDGGHGELNNDPVFYHPSQLKCDDRVDFELKHVAGILRSSTPTKQ